MQELRIINLTKYTVCFVALYIIVLHGECTHLVM